MTHLHFKDASKELIVCVELETPEERLAFNQFVLEKHSLPPNSSISLANRHIIWSHSPKGNFFALLSLFFFIKCEQIPHDCPWLAYWHWPFIVITVGPLFLAQCRGLWDSPVVLTTSVLEPQCRFFANLFSSSISVVNYFAGKKWFLLQGKLLYKLKQVLAFFFLTWPKHPWLTRWIMSCSFTCFIWVLLAWTHLYCLQPIHARILIDCISIDGTVYLSGT